MIVRGEFEAVMIWLLKSLASSKPAKTAEPISDSDQADNLFMAKPTNSARDYSATFR